MISLLLIKPLMKNPISPATEDVGIPLNLFILKTYLQDNCDIDINIFDERLNRITNSSIDILDEIAKHEIIGITTSSSDFSRSIEIARYAKKIDPYKIVILGGIFVYSNEAYILSNYPEIDFLISGEGEQPFSKLINAIKNKTNKSIPGVSFRAHNDIILNNKYHELLSSNKIPLVKIPEKILTKYKPFDNGSIYASRGCIYSCSFCTISNFWKNSYRTRAIDHVLQEIYHYYNVGFQCISFKDENFLQNKEWANTLLNEIKALKLKLNLKIKSRLNLIEPNNLSLYRDSGITEIQIGIEDISQQVQKSLQKYTTTKETAIDILRGMSNNDITANYIFMFGLSGSTDKTIAENVDYIKNLYDTYNNIKPYFTFLAPQPYANQFTVNKKYTLLNNNLNYYTHLFPVAVPKSLGDWKYGSNLMIKGYNEVVEYTRTSHLNPLITFEYEDLLVPTINHIMKY